MRVRALRMNAVAQELPAQRMGSLSVDAWTQSDFWQSVLYLEVCESLYVYMHKTCHGYPATVESKLYGVRAVRKLPRNTENVK
jgi:hypothetical protein